MKPIRIHLAEGSFSDDFFPFTLTRAVADIRCGILTIREKWARFFPLSEPGAQVITIPSNTLPDPVLIEAIRSGDPVEIEKRVAHASKLMDVLDILRSNDREIRRDFDLVTRNRTGAPVSVSNRIIGAEKPGSGQIFIEPGATVEHALLNVSDGPIYIGKQALVMEGSSIRGPFTLGEGAVVKMGTRIYGPSGIGPFCTVGGEIKHAILFGYSNKAHDGYLGDSVIGEWCNLGAGTSNSNVKNTAGEVSLWIPPKNKYLKGGIKCGLFMGDYSRAAINTSFNTGTMVGVSANVFGKGLTPAYLSSFSWGFDPVERYDFEKAIRHIRQWKKQKNKELEAEEIMQLRRIYENEVPGPDPDETLPAKQTKSL